MGSSTVRAATYTHRNMQFTRAHGVMAARKATDSSLLMRNTGTLVSGGTIRKMEMGHTSILMGKDTKADGRETKNMGTEVTNTETEITIVDSGDRTIDTERAPWSITTALPIRVDGRRENSTEGALSLSRKETTTRGSGRQARCMAREHSPNLDKPPSYSGNMADWSITSPSPSDLYPANTRLPIAVNNNNFIINLYTLWATRFKRTACSKRPLLHRTKTTCRNTTANSTDRRSYRIGMTITLCK